MRYFFDVRSRCGHARDREGLDLKDHSQIEPQLLRAIAKVAYEEFALRPRGQVTGFVRDEDGNRTYSAVIVYAAKRLR